VLAHRGGVVGGIVAAAGDSVGAGALICRIDGDCGDGGVQPSVTPPAASISP